MNKNLHRIFSLGAFTGGVSVALAGLFWTYDPQPSNPSITVTDTNFGTAIFTVEPLFAGSANRLAAAIACVRGEIPWNLAPVKKLLDDKVQQIRLLEEKVKSFEKTPPQHTDMIEPPSWVPSPWNSTKPVGPYFGNEAGLGEPKTKITLRSLLIVDGSTQLVPWGTKLYTVDGGGLYSKEFVERIKAKVISTVTVGDGSEKN